MKLNSLTVDDRFEDPSFLETDDMALKVESTEMLRTFLKQRRVREALKKISLKIRIFAFGNIETQASEINNLAYFIPLNVNKESLQSFVNQNVDALLRELKIDPESNPTFRTALQRFVWRNLKRNLDLFWKRKGSVHVVPVSITDQNRMNFGTDIKALLASDLSDDDLAKDTYGSEDEPHEIMDEVANEEHLSFEELLVKAARLHRRNDLSPEEKLACLFEILSPKAGDLPNREMAKHINKALNASIAFFSDLSESLARACQEVAPYAPDGLRPPTIQQKIDPRAEIRVLNAVEMLNRLYELSLKNDKTPEDLRTSDEIQYHLGIAIHYLRLVCSPYYEKAEELSRDLGRKFLEDPMFVKDHFHQEYLDIEGKEGKVPIEFRMAQVPVKRGLAPLEVYLPNEFMRGKRERSAISKLAREESLEVEHMFDMWGGKLIVNHTVAEIRGNPEVYEKIMSFIRQLMANQGFKERNGTQGKEKPEKSILEPGQFLIEEAWAPKNVKSNGYPIVKIYFRTKRGEHTPLGVPCEMQIIPLDTWKDTESPVHPSNHAFYDIKKLAKLVKNVISDSVFPNIHEQARFIEACLDNFIKTRS